jgi:hypothetical protein
LFSIQQQKLWWMVFIQLEKKEVSSLVFVVGLAYQGKGRIFVFKFIIEYSSFRDYINRSISV